MEKQQKTTRFFSKPLMKQTIKTNRALFLVIVVIMCLMSNVVNFAMSIMGESTPAENAQEAQADFYSYLYVLASYNEMSGAALSYEDFEDADDRSVYEQIFEMMNAQSDLELSVEGFEEAADTLSEGDIALETYVHQFEYTYALGNIKGCFTGEDLNMEDLMNTMFETMGISSDIIETLGSMDMTTMLNQMYFTVMGLLPIFLFIVIVANSLFVDQVDKGSMAYVLSTPTKRSAIVITQGVFLVAAPLLIIAIVCVMRILSSFVFFDEVNVPGIIMLYTGMYVLVEAVAGICYFGSCFFNRSRSSMAFGGGITVWFFLASLLGMFGSSDLVNMGMGVKELGIFNKLTLVGLYDIKALETVGTGDVNMDFAWKLIVLAVTAAVFYAAGAVRFQKKDLPL